MVVRGIILQRTRQQPEQGEDKPLYLSPRQDSPTMPTHASASNERTVNRLPKEGEHKASPLLWTIWLAKRLRSIVGEPWLVDKYIPCGRLAAGMIQHCILSFTR